MARRNNISLFAILLAILSLSSAQTQWGQQQQYNRPGNNQRPAGGFFPSGGCSCTQEYVPFCSTDGRQERTYSNRCELECAQKLNPNLRIKFEGVCAKPYVPSTGGQPTPRPTRVQSSYTVVNPGSRPSSGQQTWNYGTPVPNTHRPWVQQPSTTARTTYSQSGAAWGQPGRGGSSWQTDNQNRVSGPYNTGSSSSIRPWYESTTIRSPYSRYPPQSSSIRPWYESTTTRSPYSRYPPQSSNYGGLRGNRDVEEDDNDDSGEDSFDERK